MAIGGWFTGTAVTVSAAVFLTDRSVAVRVTVTGGLAGIVVVTRNETLVCPTGTFTLLGTLATNVLLDASVTLTPAVGAAPLIVTTPVAVAPPATAVGST